MVGRIDYDTLVTAGVAVYGDVRASPVQPHS
jgi:hypothetical protein